MDQQDSDRQDNRIQGDKTKGGFKAKLGFFFGYNGQKFLGMQFQRQHPNTIENTMHALLLENGFILKSNADQLRRIRWSRAARTDKKVHALCNGISAKLQINQKYVSDLDTREINYNRIINDLNDQLPLDIRILILRRVGKSFDMRHDAKTRIYNYIIPSRLFQSFAKFSQNLPIEGQELQNVILKLNGLVKFYLGTHNYWNFTRGYKKTDPRCERFMIKMSTEKVEQQTVKTILKQCGRNQDNDYESFIRFTLIGQSFIYHQIRKMIGLLIKIFSEELQGQSTIKQAFKPEHFDVYLAPGQGLYLNRMTFESYNNRRDTRQKIQFTQDQEERIRKYRAYLETKIVKHQIQEQVFTGWLAHRKDYDNKQQEQEQQKSEQSNQNNKSNKKEQKFNKKNYKNKNSKQVNQKKQNSNLQDKQKKEQKVEEPIDNNNKSCKINQIE